MFRRVLHATDFSPASRAAFDRAVKLAAAGRGRLIIAHVLAPVVPLMADGYVAPSTYEQIEASARQAAGRKLKDLVARAARRRVKATTLLLDGVAHEQIVRAARAQRADVVVVGTHGRTGVARMFLGSVAGRVVATATCPVLTVRGRSAR